MKMQSYKTLTFKDMGSKKLETVREKLETMWRDGNTAEEISKRLKISPRSAATAMGNLTRKRATSVASRKTTTSRKSATA